MMQKYSNNAKYTIICSKKYNYSTFIVTLRIYLCTTFAAIK